MAGAQGASSGAGGARAMGRRGVLVLVLVLLLLLVLVLVLA